MQFPAPNRPIRPADLPTEREAIAATLARAFHADPEIGWMLPDAKARTARLPAFFGHMLRAQARHARVIAAPRNIAASVWLPPGHTTLPITTMLVNVPALLGVFGRHAPRALRMSHAIERHFPDGRFWYAQFVGVDPAFQGKGWGAALMRTGLEFAKADGLPAYLETSVTRNVGFYRALGFDVIAEWSLPAGPRMWSMLHP